MSGLPSQWVWTDTRSIAEVQGGIQKQPKRAPVRNQYAFLRVANVPRGRLDLTDVHMVELFDGELERYRLQRGDLLVVEGNGSPNQIGRSALWLGEIENCVHQNHLIRVRVGRAVTPYYLNYYWNSPQTKEHLRSIASSTSGLYVLTAAKVRDVRLPLPPLAEQNRIVAAIEEQFSRLDAGVAALERVRINSLRLFKARLEVEFAPKDNEHTWQCVAAGALAADGRHSLAIGPFGSDLKVSDYKDEGVPLVFVRNIRSESFAGSAIKYVSQVKAEALRSHKVEGGDVLITKMGDPPGDTAVYPFSLPIGIITADCIKLTLRPEYDPYFVALAMRTRNVRAQFRAITSGVAQQKVSLARFRDGIQVEVPEYPEQLAIVRRLEAAQTQSQATLQALDDAKKHASALRASILSAAFSGKLVSQNSSDEPASVLLERIAAERASSNGHKPRKQRAQQEALL